MNESKCTKIETYKWTQIILITICVIQFLIITFSSNVSKIFCKTLRNSRRTHDSELNKNWTPSTTGNNFSPPEGYYEDFNIKPGQTNTEDNDNSVPLRMVQPGHPPITPNMIKSVQLQTLNGNLKISTAFF